jgi:hypothetical protein
VSEQAITGVRPFRFRNSAILATVVVFPPPLGPTRASTATAALLAGPRRGS